MRTTLGTFEGRVIEASALKVAGSMGEKVGTLEQGEEVYLIVKGYVTAITHGFSKETFTRLHKVSATNVVLIDREDGRRMLTEAVALQDDRFGLQQMFSEAELVIAHDPMTGEIVPERPQVSTQVLTPEQPSAADGEDDPSDEALLALDEELEVERFDREYEENEIPGGLFTEEEDE